MPYAYHPTKTDGRAVAVANKLKILKAVRLFGHLRRSEIGMAVWPETSENSAKIMAYRTVKSMLKDGLLLEKRNTLGGHSLVLTTKAVSYLRNYDIAANDGYNLAVDGPQFYHRLLGTCYLLERAKLGDVVFGEYSIMKKWAPLTREESKIRFKKVPDGLIALSGAIHGIQEDVRVLDWIEIESAYKPYADVEMALNLFKGSSYLNDSGSLILGKLVFVCDSRQHHDRRLLRFVRKFLKNNPALDAESVLKEIIIAKCYIDVPFVWRGVEEKSVWDILVERGGVNLEDPEDDDTNNEEEDEE